MLDNGRLNTRMPTDAAGLSNALQQAANAGEPTALAIHRKSGQSPYHAVLRPIGPTRQISASDACISVSISDPQRSCGVSPTQFKQLYKLSKREAELTGLLLDGATLSEAAERMGIAEATARTNLNRVYNKLGVRRQSELMRLFWGSVLDGITGLD
jgi:DNA-binding CsgD family transcriptional regulator